MSNAERAREVIARLLVAALIFGATYLIGAFGNASFNIADWSWQARATIAALGGFMALMAATYPFERYSA